MGLECQVSDVRCDLLALEQVDQRIEYAVAVCQMTLVAMDK